MTEPLTLALAAVTLLVALAAAWAHLPRELSLDGERWFKVLLATGLRGAVDEAGGDAEAWAAAVIRFAPYHPAGREPERKVTAPSVVGLPGAALPGERALVEALARIDGLPARWARMYDEDERALAVRLDDPAELGPAYDPARVLGPGASWDAVAAWEDGLKVALDRRLPARWVLVDGAPSGMPDLLGALYAELGDRVAARITWDAGASREEAAATVRAALAAAAPDPGDRVVLAAAGEGVLLAIAGLREAPDARDRLLGVVALGGTWGGWPGRDGPWGEAAVADAVGAWFRHDQLDAELAHARPWFSAQWLDRSASPPGAGGLPLTHQRPPVPADEGGLESSIARVDLGVLPADADLPAPIVARALWTLVAGWHASR